MDDPVRALAVLDRLHDKGIGLALDDFGTGYSSLSYLKRLPVQEVKIDRTFVATMVSDESDAAIVRSVVDLGTNLQLRVVAEGVEDEATWQQLAGMGCHVAQGFHLSRPMPIEEFPAWLQRYESSDQWPAETVAALG
jgi:EAL domain-containing protein (putative c-di-GMP-specific phosphodiesterase class I)